MARSKQSKSKQMKIKQPSLKGMKNTSYLGHFAQDEFIKQGHNFSGRVEMSKFTGTPDIERFAVSNPFEAGKEFQRRKDIVEQEAGDILSRYQSRASGFQQTGNPYRDISTFGEEVVSPAAQEIQQINPLADIGNIFWGGEPEKGVRQAVRTGRKKFLEEL